LPFPPFYTPHRSFSLPYRGIEEPFVSVPLRGGALENFRFRPPPFCRSIVSVQRLLVTLFRREPTFLRTSSFSLRDFVNFSCFPVDDLFLSSGDVFMFSLVTTSSHINPPNFPSSFVFKRTFTLLRDSLMDVVLNLFLTFCSLSSASLSRVSDVAQTLPTGRCVIFCVCVLLFFLNVAFVLNRMEPSKPPFNRSSRTAFQSPPSPSIYDAARNRHGGAFCIAEAFIFATISLHF